MSRRRVAVTSPQTRMALGARRGAPVQSTVDAAALREAEGVRRRQLRIAAGTLAGAAVLLVGLPVVLGLLPVDVRLGAVPVGWIAVAVLPYPLLALLAHLQLRRAERAERHGAERAERHGAEHTDRFGAERADGPGAGQPSVQRRGARTAEDHPASP